MLSRTCGLRAQAVCGVSVLVCFALGCGRSARLDYLPQLDSAPRANSNRVEYSFGVLPLHNAVLLFETYQPLIDEINAHVSGFTVRLETAKDHPTYERKARDGRLDFVMMNAHLVIRTEERGYNIIGRAAGNIRGLVLVRKDSTVVKARDLRGASVSFGARTDLAGAMMQKLLLKQNGLDVERDAKPKYVGSPESAIENVYSGRSAAACVSESAWKAFETRRPAVARDLRVRWATMPLMGMGILARRDIPRDRVQMVMRVLFDLDDSESGRKILQAMSISSFRPAEEASYDPVWEFLNDYRRAFRYVPVLGGAE